LVARLPQFQLEVQLSGRPISGVQLMVFLRKFLQLPANESSVSLVLGVSVVALGLMSLALVWQAEIIANQREVIRWLEAMKIGA